MPELTEAEIVKQFSQLLARTTDATERERFVKRANMLAVSDAPEEAFKAPIRTLGQYLASDIIMPPALVNPFMCVRGGVNVTVGRAGKGKTVMNLNRNMRWSAGLPWFDGWVDKEGTPIMAPNEPLKILIVENEGAAGMFHRQIGLMLASEKHMTDEHRELAKENLLVWGEGGYSGLKLDDAHKLGELRAGVEEWQPDLVFIEPFRSLWSGEENNATEMAVVNDALVALATDFNCGVWAAHHEKKGGMDNGEDKMNKARGSTALEGVVTVMENFEAVKGGDFREVSWSKSRHEAAPPTVRMEWDAKEWWYTWVPNDAIEDTIMTAMQRNADEPMTVKDLIEATEESDGKIRKALKKMQDDKKIKTTPNTSGGHGGSGGMKYRLASTDSDEYGGLAV